MRDIGTCALVAIIVLGGNTRCAPADTRTLRPDEFVGRCTSPEYVPGTVVATYRRWDATYEEGYGESGEEERRTIWIGRDGAVRIEDAHSVLPGNDTPRTRTTSRVRCPAQVSLAAYQDAARCLGGADDLSGEGPTGEADTEGHREGESFGLSSTEGLHAAGLRRTCVGRVFRAFETIASLEGRSSSEEPVATIEQCGEIGPARDSTWACMPALTLWADGRFECEQRAGRLDRRAMRRVHAAFARAREVPDDETAEFAYVSASGRRATIDIGTARVFYEALCYAE